MSIAENYRSVEENVLNACLKAGRARDAVQLIAVSKYVDTDRIQQAVNAGCTAVGENHAQEVREKLTFFKLNGLKVHFIGQLQTNKIKYVCSKVDLIQSVDRPKLMISLESALEKDCAKQAILFQVNIGREEQKGGVLPENLPELMDTLSLCPSLVPCGLMCVPPENEPDRARYYFSQLYELRERMQSMYPEICLRELSMGMSRDYTEAIAEGATMVRVGSAIFGARNRL